MSRRVVVQSAVTSVGRHTTHALVGPPTAATLNTARFAALRHSTSVTAADPIQLRRSSPFLAMSTSTTPAAAATPAVTTATATTTASRKYRFYREDFGPLESRPLHLNLYFDVIESRVIVTNHTTFVYEPSNNSDSQSFLTSLQLNSNDLEIVSVDRVSEFQSLPADLTSGAIDFTAHTQSFSGATPLKHSLDTDNNILTVELNEAVRPGQQFVVKLVTIAHPSANILEGFYYDYTVSGCPRTIITQCQQYGFQRITPCMDYMTAKAYYTTTITADKRYTNVISNGDLAPGYVTPEGKEVRHPPAQLDPIDAVEAKIERSTVCYHNHITNMAPYLFFFGTGTYRTHTKVLEYPDGDTIKLELLCFPNLVEPQYAEMAIQSLHDSVMWVYLSTGPEAHLHTEERQKIYDLIKRREQLRSSGSDESQLQPVRHAIKELLKVWTKTGYKYTGKVYREIGMENCFPQEDHEVLTESGFLSYAQVKDSLERPSGQVRIACPVRAEDGQYRLEYHAIDARGLRESVSNEFVEMRGALTEFQQKTDTATQIDLSHTSYMNLVLTPGHRLVARMASKGAMSTSTWQDNVTADDIAASSSEFVQLAHQASLGVTDPATHLPLPFVTALGFTTPDQEDAFIELYGYWLGVGSLSLKDSGVTFNPTNPVERDYLDALFKRLEAALPRMASMGSDQYDSSVGGRPHCVRVQPLSSAGQRWGHKVEDQVEEDVGADRCAYVIYSPRWFSYFAEQYGHKYGVHAHGLEASIDRTDDETTDTDDNSEVTTTAFTSFSFSDSTELEETIRLGSPQPQDLEGANSAKRLWSWVLQRLEARRLRLLLRGLRYAGGNQSVENKAVSDLQSEERRFRAAGQIEKADAISAQLADMHTSGWSLTGGEIATVSIRGRDEFQHVCLRAGYTAIFRRDLMTDQLDNSGDAKRDLWFVMYLHPSSCHALPNLVINPKMVGDVREVTKVQSPMVKPVWCVTVPTADHLIIVRRVKREDGVIVEASLPTITGNSDYGGMENVGNTTILSSRLVPSPLQSDPGYVYMEGVKVHEFYHNINGSEVTGQSPFEIWLNEAVTVHIQEKREEDLFGRDFMRLKTVVYSFMPSQGPLAIDKSIISMAIEPEGFNRTQELISAMTYSKAPEFIRMVALLIGEDKFNIGLDHYHTKFRYSNATTSDWIAAMEWASGQSLQSMAHGWLKRTGYPEVSYDGQYDAAKRQYVVNIQQTVAASDSKPWDFPIAWALVKDGKNVREGVLRFAEQSTSFVIDDVSVEPDFLSFARHWSFFGTATNTKAMLPTLRLQALSDTDTVNRYFAYRAFVDGIKAELVTALVNKSSDTFAISPDYVELHTKLLFDDAISPSTRAILLTENEDLPARPDLSHRYWELFHAKTALLQAVYDANAERIIAKFEELSGKNQPGPHLVGLHDRALKAHLYRLMHAGCATPTVLKTRQQSSVSANVIQYSQQLIYSPFMTDSVFGLGQFLSGPATDSQKRSTEAEVLSRWSQHPDSIENYIGVISTLDSDSAPQAIRALINNQSLFNFNLAGHARTLARGWASNRKRALLTDEGLQLTISLFTTIGKINQMSAQGLLRIFNDVEKFSGEWKGKQIKALRQMRDGLDAKAQESLTNQIKQILEKVSDQERREKEGVKTTIHLA